MHAQNFLLWLLQIHSAFMVQTLILFSLMTLMTLMTLILFYRWKNLGVVLVDSLVFFLRGAEREIVMQYNLDDKTWLETNHTGSAAFQSIKCRQYSKPPSKELVFLKKKSRSELVVLVVVALNN